MKTLTTLVLLVSFQALALQNPMAQNGQGQVQLFGAGSVSCQKFLQLMQTQDASSHLVFHSYFQGYASAATAVFGKSVFQNGQDAQNFVNREVSMECQKQPQAQFGQVVDMTLQRVFLPNQK